MHGKEYPGERRTIRAIPLFRYIPVGAKDLSPLMRLPPIFEHRAFFNNSAPVRAAPKKYIPFRADPLGRFPYTPVPGLFEMLRKEKVNGRKLTG